MPSTSSRKVATAAAAILVCLAPAARVAASEGRGEWIPSPDDLGTDGVLRRRIGLRTEGPCEVVVWAEALDASVRLRWAAEDAPPAAATATDPVALIVVAPPAGEHAFVLECDGPGPVRFGWRADALDAARRGELDALRGRLEDLAPGDAAALARDLEELLDELAGPDGRVRTWRGSQLAREIGERAARGSLHALSARAMDLAAAYRTAAVPPRSRHLLEVELMAARALTHTREAAEARVRLEHLLPLLESLHGPASTTSLETLQDLAACHRLEGDVEGARDLYLEAVDRAREALPADHPEHVRLRHNAAVACFELGDLWRSLQLDREALALLATRAEPIVDFERAIRLQLALTTTALGSGPPDFEEEHRRVLAELELVLGSSHVDVLRLKSNLAGALADAGRLEPALPLAQEVLDARADALGPDHPDTLFSLMRLAQVLNGLGEPEEALALQRAALERCEATRAPGDPFVRKVRAAVVRTLRATGSADEARARALDWIGALQDEVRSSMVASWRERRERLADLRADVMSLAMIGAEPDVDDAWRVALFELVETARAAAAAGPPRSGSGADDELRALYERHAELRRALGQSVASTPGARPGAAIDRDRLIEARHALDAHERDLARALAGRGIVDFRPIELARLTRTLGPRTAAVGFTAFDAGIERPLGRSHGDRELWFQVTLVTPDGRLSVRLEPSLCELESAVARWRAAVRVPVDDGELAADERAAVEREAGSRILELLFGTWLDELSPDVDTLQVCVEGALALVPLDALAWRDGMLGDRLRVRLASSFAARPAGHEPPATRRLLAVGGLDYGGPCSPAACFTALPGSAEEARTVARLFERSGGGETVLLEGALATPATVAAELARSTHALLATHGAFDDGLLESLGGAPRGELGDAEVAATLAPLSLSRLALSGANKPAADGARTGLLTGEELAGLDLAGLELVALSACDTNRTLRRGGLGVLSLSTALHAAGARRSLTSLWRVKTDYGRDLVERFFERVLDGASADEALWEAKLLLRDERRLPTRFWAGWVLSETLAE